MKCHNCNNEVPVAGGFCPYCGARIEKAQRREFVSQTSLQPMAGKQSVSGASTDRWRAAINQVQSQPEDAVYRTESPQQSSNKNRIPQIIGAVLFAVIAIIVVAYFTIHDYTEATCTTAETCTICGATRGSALGHKWEAATLYTPKTCNVCYETSGNSLARLLSDSELDYDWSDKKKTFNIKDGWTISGYAAVLDYPIENCVSLTVNLEVTEMKGDLDGEWGLWVRGSDGKWSLLNKFKYKGEPLSVTFDYDTPVSFDRYYVGCRESYIYSYSCIRYIDDVWVLN